MDFQVLNIYLPWLLKYLWSLELESKIFDLVILHHMYEYLWHEFGFLPSFEGH